jgi:hypothetical protein
MSFQVASFMHPSMAELKNVMCVSALALSPLFALCVSGSRLFRLGLDETLCHSMTME